MSLPFPSAPPAGGSQLVVQLLGAGSSGQISNHNNLTINGLAAGAAASDRYLVGHLTHWGALGSNPTLTTLTMSSITPTIHVNQAATASGAGTCRAIIFSFPYPTGTTVDFFVQWSSTVKGTGLRLYRMTGLSNVTPITTASAGVNNNLTCSSAIDIPSGGTLLLSGVCCETGFTSATLNGVPSVDDAFLHLGGFAGWLYGHQDDMGGETAHAISLVGGGSSSGAAIAVAGATFA